MVARFLAMAPAHALQITDDRGVSATFVHRPQRIASLRPSRTESVCAPEQCQCLAGADRDSNHPVSAYSLPVVGGALDPNIEAIVALQPDAVRLWMQPCCHGAI